MKKSRKKTDSINPNHKIRISLMQHFQDTKITWVKENTAILIVHGIGNQLPLETIDQFGRGLIEEYERHFANKIRLEHCIVTKEETKDPWFDNVVRIKLEGNPYHIDLYEYFWANYTEDKATWKDIWKWLNGVVKGAKKFYKYKEEMGKAYKDISPFFNKRTGEFKSFKYRLFVSILAKAVVFWSPLVRLASKILSSIPIVGKLLGTGIKSFSQNVSERLVNVLGDITIYNVVDPKSCFYPIRRQIMDGAVKAVKFLIERQNNKGDLTYPTVIVAGHSLGSQVAYDAINRFNLFINQGLIESYNPTGIHKKTRQKISEQLRGFVSFGSPLDKIAFFLQEAVPNDEYLRQWIVASYHCFKQRDLNLTQMPSRKYAPSIERLMDDVKWVNYHDTRDAVSGSLDYYKDVRNIDCELQQCVREGKRALFTHSDYWKCKEFYRHIILSFLSNPGEPRGPDEPMKEAHESVPVA